MKVELHLHTCRYSACAVDTPDAMMHRLIDEGYGAVFITEHDRAWGDWEMEDLRAAFPGLLIFPGMEVSLGPNRSMHLLVLGTNDSAYLRLPTAQEVIALAASRGHLTVLAHPFRWPGGDDVLQGPVRPDAIELNTCNHDPEMAKVSQETSVKLGLPVVNADDAHTLDMVGRFWIETAKPLENPGDIRQIILSGSYTNHMAETPKARKDRKKKAKK